LISSAPVKKAAGRNPDRDEGPVVGAPVEWRRLDREPDGGEVVEENVLDVSGSGWPGVAVVDEPHVVRRADHVEVEHDGDVLALPLRERDANDDLALKAQVVQLLADGEAREHDRNVEGAAERPDERIGSPFLSFVEDDDGAGARLDRVLDLFFERAGSALDEGDVPLHESGEVRVLTAGVRRTCFCPRRDDDVVGRLDGRRDVTAARILHGEEVGFRGVDLGVG